MELEVTEATLLRLQKGDLLHVVIKSNYLEPEDVSRIRDSYSKKLNALLGEGFVSVVVMHIDPKDVVELTVVKKEE